MTPLDQLASEYADKPDALVVTLPEGERGYLAGILDGEGCIAITRHKPNARDPYEYFNARVDVSNTNLDLLHWLADRFGGKPRQTWASQNLARPTEKIVYSWKLDAQRARPVLLAALPYLVVKRRQAEIALVLISTKTRNYGRGGVPRELKDLHRSIYEEAKALNRKGRRP